MRTIKAMGAAIMSVLAIGALAASASAAEFHSTKANAKLKGRALTSQVFVTKAGTISCAKLTAEGTAAELESTTLQITIIYASCTVFGFIEVHIGEFAYLLMANGTKDLLKAVTIETTGCVMTIPAQSGLGASEVVNNEGALKIINKITGFTSSGKGSTCEYEEESLGTYSGDLEVESPEAELSFS